METMKMETMDKKEVGTKTKHSGMTSSKSLTELKLDAQIMQQKGLPFMMASVVIWCLIYGGQFLDKDVVT